MENNFSSISKFAEVNNDLLSVEDNCYFWKTETVVKGKKQEPVINMISNFIIEPLYLLRSQHNPKRIFKIVNHLDQSETLTCSVKSMTNIGEFKAVVEAQGNFIINAQFEQYAHIKESIYAQEKNAVEIDTLGHQLGTSLYAFGNGIFDGKKFYSVNDFGICTIGENNYFIPEYSEIYIHDAAYTERRKFKYKQGKADVTQWSKLILECFGTNGNVGIGYIVACLFRDVIFNKIGRFPMLYLFGAPQSGKSTFRDSFMYLFGDPQTTPSLGSASSPKSFNRKLAQYRNGLIVFEEYKNDIQTSLIEMLKGIYDGIGYERAETSNDNRTKTTPVNSSVIVCGQEMPTKEAALFSRSIMLVFEKTKFDSTENKAYSLLKTTQSQGLGQVLTEILKHRQLIVERFKSEFDSILHDLINDTMQTENFPQRWLENLAVIIAPFKILQDVVNFGFDYTKLLHTLCDNMKVQGAIMRENNEVNTFFEVLDELIEKNMISKDDYTDDITDINRCLSFCYKSIYGQYVAQCKRENLRPIEKQSLTSYLKTSHGFKEYKQKKIGKKIKWFFQFEFKI